MNSWIFLLVYFTAFWIILLDFWLQLHEISSLIWKEYNISKWSHSLLGTLSLSLLCYAAAAKSLQSCLALRNHIDGSPPGSPVPGILQARTLEWVAISFSNAWKWKVKVKSLSLRGSSIHGIFQARVLEWIAIAFSVMLWPLGKVWEFFFNRSTLFKIKFIISHLYFWSLLQITYFMSHFELFIVNSHH